MTEQEFLDRAKEICYEEGATRVMLFGSRARGTNQRNSDFDLGVFGVGNVRRIVERIDELPTLFSADVVNMQRCRNEALVKEVEEDGVLV